MSTLIKSVICIALAIGVMPLALNEVERRNELESKYELVKQENRELIRRIELEQEYNQIRNDLAEIMEEMGL